MSQPLLPALNHIEGETHSSFTARLAALHESKPREFCSDMGMRWPYLCSGYKDQLDRLAWLTGTDLERLLLWCPQRISIGRYRVGQTFSSKWAFRRAQVRICPRCAIDAFERGGPAGLFQLLEWSVCCLYRCELHGIELMALPLAKTSHETYDVVAQILHHLPAVRNAAEAEGSLDKSTFEAYVRTRILVGAQDDWLRGLDLTQLYRACLTLGTVLARIPVCDAVKFSTNLEREVCQFGFSGLAHGPQGLRDKLDRLRSKAKAARPNASSDMGVFYTWLQSTHDDPALTAVASCVREYVFQEYPITSKRDILGKPLREVSFITFDEARKRSRLGVCFLKRLLCHLDGLPFDETENMTEISLVDLRRIQRFWCGLCNLKEASSILGLLPIQVKGLMRLGVFSTVRFGSALRYLKRDEVRLCLAEVDKLPSILDTVGFVPLKEFCRLNGIPLIKVVAEWRLGHLDSLVRRVDGIGLHQIAVRSNAMCGKQSLTLTRDLTLPETATYLQISVISIRKLRDAGLLTQVQNRNLDTNHLRSYISQTSIQCFEKHFTTLGKVAEEFGIAPIHLARRFDREGIAPIKQVSGMVRVYERYRMPSNIAATN